MILCNMKKNNIIMFIILNIWYDIFGTISDFLKPLYVLKFSSCIDYY